MKLLRGYPMRYPMGMGYPLGYPISHAELYALVWLIQNVKALSIIQYITDNLGLKDTFDKGPKAGAVSSNADLYSPLSSSLQIRV